MGLLPKERGGGVEGIGAKGEEGVFKVKFIEFHECRTALISCFHFIVELIAIFSFTYIHLCTHIHIIIICILYLVSTIQV